MARPIVQAEPGHNLVQTATPSSVQTGQTWFNPTDNSQQVWNGVGPTGNKWIKDIGWIGGTFAISTRTTNGSQSSIISKVIFPFDSGTATSGGYNSASTSWNQTYNSSAHGYFAGGNAYSAIFRTDFKFDASLNTYAVGNLPTSNYAMGGGASNTIYGYCSEGTRGGVSDYSGISRTSFPFSSGTMTQVGNKTTSSVSWCNCLNSTNYAYYVGMWNYQLTFGLSTPTQYSIVNRIQYPYDSGTASSYSNTNTSRAASCTFNSTVYGYNAGGNNIYSSTYLSIIDRILYPFVGTAASTTGNLSSTNSPAGGANSLVYGYAFGSDGNNTSNVERVAFPLDSGVGTVVGTLLIATSTGATMDNTDHIAMFV